MFGLCVQPLSLCFLGVTCAFVLKGGEPCGLRDAYSHADYMFSVSSCLSKPAPDATHTKPRGEERREKSKSARFPSLNEKHTEHFSKKEKVSFICFLPASFCFGFFCLIAEDSNPERLEVSSSCGKSGGSCRIALRLSCAKKHSVTFDTNIHPTPPLYRNRGRGRQPAGRSHSTLPQRFRERKRFCPSHPTLEKGQSSVPWLTWATAVILF